jgi:hypothetical protein
MFVLFDRHVGEDASAGGIIISQFLGEVSENTSVFLFVADRQGKDFPLGQIDKTPRRHVFSLRSSEPIVEAGGLWPRMVFLASRLLSPTASVGM